MNTRNGTTENAASSSGNFLRSIQERLSRFPAMPVFVSQIMGLVKSPDVDIHTIADHIRLDPGITANILKLANSAQFGAFRSIRSLQEAIVRLGLNQLFQLVVTYGIANRLAKVMPGYELRREELLAHSLWCALASEEFCKVLKMETPDMMFTAGLLHDLGKLPLDDFVSQAKTKLLQTVEQDKKGFDACEEKILGMDHAEAGAKVLDSWNFPAPLVAAARWHHHPEKAGPFASLVGIVHIAEFLAYEEGVGAGVDGFTYRLSDEAVSHLKLKSRMIEYVASQTLDKMNNLEQLLLKP
jgi:putative nucleotidyltransferase with HDIG domain